MMHWEQEQEQEQEQKQEQGYANLRGDDSVSSPTTCRCRCVVTCMEIVDVIHDSTNENQSDVRKRAMSIIRKRPDYKSVQMVSHSPIPQERYPAQNKEALLMAEGLNREGYWDIVPTLSSHEFFMFWICFLFLRPIPVYICIHDPDTGLVCNETLRYVQQKREDVASILQDGLWENRSRATISHQIIQAILGHKEPRVDP
jgi:hypothetical protein